MKRTFTPEWIENLRKASIKAGCRPPSRKGSKWTPGQYAARAAWRGKPNPAVSGARNPNWRGGTSSQREAFVMTAAYKAWRQHVFQRDNYTCQACGQRGGKLNADHELPYSQFPDQRLEILNGRTLCEPCHRKTPTFAGRRSPFTVELPKLVIA